MTEKPTPSGPPAVLVVTVEVDEADVDELNRWYEEEHRPEKMSLPGYRSMRRYRAADGSPRFLAVYESVFPGPGRFLECRPVGLIRPVNWAFEPGNGLTWIGRQEPPLRVCGNFVG